jgi:hypothetical protein
VRTGSRPPARHSAFGDWIAHDAAGFFTFWLVIVGLGQAGLFAWQLHYMRKSIGDAKSLALAAQASAETAKEQVAVTKMGVIDLERAYLAVGPTEIKIDFIPQGPQKQVYVPSDPQQLTVQLLVHNTGRTGATIKKIFAQFSDLLPSSKTPIYNDELIKPIPTDLGVSAGNQVTLDAFKFTSNILGRQFFWGYIEYLDIFKNRRTSRFCTHLEPAPRLSLGKYEIAGGDPWRECD